MDVDFKEKKMTKDEKWSGKKGAEEKKGKGYKKKSGKVS